ncbi:MauE/DoxX family redox-associated membrane protein [Streptomyces sp. C]|uniref:MauE/DoxX family redox-associated membrane protein n=1 Tax=Streptomyces sp. C TaxID=253839 RepID=UPI0001B58350|nr:MauE/DoxX family redox-associated membrane protein [Streptomyces sp. C]EFL19459.1 predicted protein [Streptomyces sp. C]
MTYFLIFAEVFFFAVFAMAAIMKIRRFSAFEHHVKATLPRAISGAPLLAGSVISVEVAVASSMLLPPPFLAYGFTLAAVVCAAFTAYVVRLVRRNGGESCGCMGESDVSASPLHVGRNCALLLLAVAAAAGVWSAPGHGDVPPEAAEQLMVAVPALAAAAVVTLFDDLVSLFTFSPEEHH